MLRCKICALIGIELPATHVVHTRAYQPYPVCPRHAIQIAWMRPAVRTLTQADRTAIPNPPLANPGRWKEKYGRNRTYPTRKTTTRTTGA